MVGFGKGLNLAVFAALVSSVVCAQESETTGVTTNYWIATGGTEETAWSDPANWQDGRAGTRDTFADFTLVADNSTHQITGGVKSAGMVFGSADTVTNVFYFGTTALYRNGQDYIPVCVTGGVAGVGIRTSLTADGPIRKTGAGRLLLEGPQRKHYVHQTLEVDEGEVEIFNPELFFWTEIVLQGTGGLVWNHSNPFFLGALRLKDGKELDLGGSTLALGYPRSSEIPAEVRNGTVSSVGGNTLWVTNTPSSNLKYVAREGEISFVNEKPFGGIVGWWDFEDATQIGKDISDAGNHLFASNSMSVVWDDDRGGNVAYFDGKSALYGMAERGGLKGLSSGNAPHSFAYWIKVTADTPGTSAFFFWGGLPVVANKMMINKYEDNTRVFFGHDGLGTCHTSATIAGGLRDRWVHMAFTSDGKDARVYVNGELNSSYACGVNDLPNANFSIGRPWSASAVYYKGYMDDAVVVNRGLRAEEVAKLYEAGATYRREVVSIPPGTQLETVYNGKIVIGGEQRIDSLGGDAMRGGIEMRQRGSVLTMSGGEATHDIKNFAAGVSGTGSFVKDGAGTLALSGISTYDGATEVRQGTLVVGNRIVKPYAVYDFESPDDLGHDSSGNGRHLTNNGVGSEDVSSTDSPRGKVARFTAANKTDLRNTALDDSEFVANTPYTISVWAKPTSACKDGSFISMGETSKNFGQIQFRFKANPSNIVLAHWGNKLDVVADYAPGFNPKDGAWHHYVAVHEGLSFKIYCDGVMVTNFISDGTVVTMGQVKSLFVGSWFGEDKDPTRHFDGLLDDLYIYSEALSESEVALLYVNQTPAVREEMEVPDPIIHYGFEDETNLGLDSVGGCNMTQVGDLSHVESPIGGYALRFDRDAPSYLTMGCPFDVLPVSNKAFTVSFWFEADADLAFGNGHDNYPVLFSWDNPDEGEIGMMVAYWYELPWSLRLYLGTTGAAYDLHSKRDVLGLIYGKSISRLHHYATTYSPNGIVDTYLDGQRVSNLSTRESRGLKAVTEAGAVFSLGYRIFKGGYPRTAYKGIMDEVKVYDIALSQAQVRAAMRAEQTHGHRLPSTTTVSVAEGASFVLKDVAQPIAGVGGTGAVSVQDGTLELTGVSTFDGSVTGNGTIKIAAGAVVEFTKGMGAFTGTVALDGGKLTMPTTGTASAATFVLKDGVSITLDATSTEPFIATDGKISILGGGTVTLSPGVVAGTWVIARGTSVEDKGTGDLSARWSVTDLPASKKAKFRLTDSGDFVLSVSGAGTLVIFR